MSTVQEIERAVERMTPAELREFRAWFADHEAAAWDQNLEQDAASGKLDSLADEALRELRSGRTTTF